LYGVKQSALFNRLRKLNSTSTSKQTTIANYIPTVASKSKSETVVTKILLFFSTQQL